MLLPLIAPPLVDAVLVWAATWADFAPSEAASVASATCNSAVWSTETSTPDIVHTAKLPLKFARRNL